MRFLVKEISLETRKKMEILDVTRDVLRIIRESEVRNGIVNLWTPHATTAVAVNEHDIDLWEDILSAMKKLVPIEADYRHNAKYRGVPQEQNAHAHILNCMIKPNVTMPFSEGKMELGPWQSLLFIEMDGPRSRSLHVQVIGE